MVVTLSEQAIEPWSELADYQRRRNMPVGGSGACSVFVGTMRDSNQGDGVIGMFIEHYPGMTERQLLQIGEQACQRWAVADCLIMHRVGDVVPGDTLVVVACWASHRGDAGDACRFIVEALKSRAPFWKRETLVSGGQRWVEQNSDGYLRQ